MWFTTIVLTINVVTAGVHPPIFLVYFMNITNKLIAVLMVILAVICGVIIINIDSHRSMKIIA